MRVVRKVCACLLRRGAAGTEVLVFDHPVAGTQFPKGTVEADEDADAAVVRELAEETGVAATVARSLGEWRRIAGAGLDEAGVPEEHVWEIFELQTSSALPDAWQHAAVGSAAEQGLVFSCHWLAVDQAPDVVHPLFRAVAERLKESLRVGM